MGCWVPGCKSGYNSQNNDSGEKKIHFFQPPTEEARKQWQAAIKREGDKRGSLKQLSLKNKVCSLHFVESDMELFYTHVIKGHVVEIPRDKAKLKPDAVPKIFPGYPSYYQPAIKKRKGPAPRTANQTKNVKIVPNTLERIDGDASAENTGALSTEMTEPDSTIIHSAVHTEENNAVIEQIPLAKDWSHEIISELSLPVDWVVCNTTSLTEKIAVHIDPKNLQIDKSVTFSGTSAPEIIFRGSVKVNSSVEELKYVKDAQKLINSVDMMKMCEGTGRKDKPFSLICLGATSLRAKRCEHCASEKERLRKFDLRRETITRRQEQKKYKIKNRIQSLKRSKINLLLKVQRYKTTLDRIMRECSLKKREAVDEAIADLPEKQQEVVRACFNASRKKGPSGRRYTINWIYECILMKIKSPKLYKHIRENGILSVPCYSTIRGHIKNFSGDFGFQPTLFEIIKTKMQEMPESDRHGILVIDEMKLTKGSHFDQNTLQIEGMADLSPEELNKFDETVRETFNRAMENLPHDPKLHQKQKRRATAKQKLKNQRDRNLGDHALVVSFQPFKGRWVQNLACFLTRVNANDEELTKLVLEAVILSEHSGLYVDGVVTDEAKWNRAMWTKFGVNESDTNAEHPCDETRRLYFFSDWPHLLKCSRNCTVDKKIIETPEGDVQLKHWQAGVDADNLKQVGLKECPRLTTEVLNPDSWTKMKCNLAWRFWSTSAAAGMASYRFQGVDELEDCEASINFCKLMNNVADIMNSRIPAAALRLNSDKARKLEEFLDRLKQIQNYQTEKMVCILIKAEEARIQMLKQQGRKYKSNVEQLKQKRMYTFSESTDVGLVVTIKNTLALLKYLHEKLQFSYLMTARLNQDALERFFGLMRQSCGANSHPEPKVFAQLYRLLSIYSLVRPIRGSNITGGEMLSTLLNLQDLKDQTAAERKKELENSIENLVQHGDDLDYIGDLINEANDHNYLVESVDEFALSYVARFAARRCSKFAGNCEACIRAISKPKEEATDEDMLINLKSLGYLTYPTNQLKDFLRHLENQVVKTCKNNELQENILFLVVEALEQFDSTPLVGCPEHKFELSKSIMKYFLIMRMHFVCKSWNHANKNQKQKGLRKQAHLT